MKPQVMYAVFTGNKRRTMPLGIFPAHWKAKQAIDIISQLYNSRSGFRIQRVLVEFNSDQSYTITAHSYKRVSPKEIAKL